MFFMVLCETIDYNSFILEYIYNLEWPLCINRELENWKMKNVTWKMFYYLQTIAKRTNLIWAKSSLIS